MRNSRYYQLRRLASWLPQTLLTRLAKRFDDPGAFEVGPELGSSFWMDAIYERWVRIDKFKCWLRNLLR